jgi:hypothetical protein
MMQALAGGCTPEHLAAVTGFDVEVVKRLLHCPRQEFNGRHPTDRHAPGQAHFYRWPRPRLEDPPGLSPITTVGRFDTVEAAQVATDEVWAAR